MLTWIKTVSGYKTDNMRFFIERDPNRHYTLYPVTEGPDYPDYICKGTLKKCKEVAQDREDDAEAAAREAHRACGEAKEPTEAEIDAAYDRACACLPEIQAAGNRKFLTEDEAQAAIGAEMEEFRTPDSELDPSELEDQPEEVEKNRKLAEWEAKAPGERHHWEANQSSVQNIPKEVQPQYQNTNADGSPRPSGRSIPMPSVENRTREPIKVFLPCNCNNNVVMVTSRRSKQFERPRNHRCKDCGKEYTVDVRYGRPTVEEK